MDCEQLERSLSSSAVYCVAVRTVASTNGPPHLDRRGDATPSLPWKIPYLRAMSDIGTEGGLTVHEIIHRMADVATAKVSTACKSIEPSHPTASFLHSPTSSLRQVAKRWGNGSNNISFRNSNLTEQVTGSEEDTLGGSKLLRCLIESGPTSLLPGRRGGDGGPVWVMPPYE